MCQIRQEFVPHTVAPCIQRVIRRIMARRESPLRRISRKLHTRHRKERPQMQPVPFPHPHKPRSPRPAQNTQKHRLREIVRMMREYNGIASALCTNTVQEVVAADACRRFNRVSMCACIGGHIPRAEDERNPPRGTKSSDKAGIRTCFRSANPMFIVGTDELCTVCRTQDVQDLQKYK